MSGGAFDYQQYRLNDVAGEIDRIVLRQEENNGSQYKWSDKTLSRAKLVSVALKELSTAVCLIDYLVSGDICEDNFHREWDESWIELRDLLTEVTSANCSWW